MNRSGHADWQGSLREGGGHLGTDSGVLRDTAYSFPTRFGAKPGTNPEELIAAAHAGCFTMGLAFFLDESGRSAERISTTAELSLELGSAGPAITGLHRQRRRVVRRGRRPVVLAQPGCARA